MIRTGQLLADIAQSLGYDVTSIDLFRTRLATATKAQLREEVVVLRWRGKRSGDADGPPWDYSVPVSFGAVSGARHSRGTG